MDNKQNNNLHFIACVHHRLHTPNTFPMIREGFPAVWRSESVSSYDSNEIYEDIKKKFCVCDSFSEERLPTVKADAFNVDKYLIKATGSVSRN